MTHYIILKADDLMGNMWKQSLSEGWLRFIKSLREHGIPASVGIICGELEDSNERLLEAVNDINTLSNGRVEYFCHGYTHEMHEFERLKYLDARKRIAHCISLMRRRLGIDVKVFGAPGNRLNRDSVNALDDIARIKCMYQAANDRYETTDTNVLELSSLWSIEYPTHRPDYMYFKHTLDHTREYTVYQLHPFSWDWNRFCEFEKCVGYLLRNNEYKFTTPLKYIEEAE